MVIIFNKNIKGVFNELNPGQINVGVDAFTFNVQITKQTDVPFSTRPILDSFSRVHNNLKKDIFNCKYIIY